VKTNRRTIAKCSLRKSDPERKAIEQKMLRYEGEMSFAALRREKILSWGTVELPTQE
jgi:hypothetical protein